MKVADLLKQAAACGASDLHLISTCIPYARVHGELLPLPQGTPLSSAQLAELIGQLMTAEQRAILERDWSVDLSLAFDNNRYRANIFYQKLGLEAVFRIIPPRIPTADELLLPPSIVHLTDLARGLVLVTGPAGSGKSTTLACLIDLINQKRRANIVTIEDPIEFIHANKRSVVSQREIGQHTPNFSMALKYILRQDPDVLLIGEMRDFETISAALTVAETGHLVLATLHAVDAPQAIDRIIDVFPPRQQQQVRTQLAGVLRTVIAQTLLPGASGDCRVAVREIMHVNPAISNLIRTGKTHEIYSSIEMGADTGMVSFTRALTELLRKGLIDAADVPARSNAFDNSAGGRPPAQRQVI